MCLDLSEKPEEIPDEPSTRCAPRMTSLATKSHVSERRHSPDRRAFVLLAGALVARATPTSEKHTSFLDSECWRPELLRSSHFLCCGRVSGRQDGLSRPDCWAGMADMVAQEGSSAEKCCSAERLAAMDARVAASMDANADEESSPCGRAGERVWNFVERSAERVLWQGRLFSAVGASRSASGPSDNEEEEDEEWPLLADPDATYEACPAALLFALLGRSARALVHGSFVLAEHWLDAFQIWESLRWTAPLVWFNVQDPLIRPALSAAVLQVKVLQSLATRPEVVCYKFLTSMTRMLEDSAGISVTVSANGSENLHFFSSIASTSLVLSSYGVSKVFPETAECVGARIAAHMFTARRFLDLKDDLGDWHLRSLRVLENLFTLEGAAWVGMLNFLSGGLLEHISWVQDARQSESRKTQTQPSTELALPSCLLSVGPLSIWERKLFPVFSEGNKDLVLERVFALVGVSPKRQYVEIGTQSGEQCNTRYLRVRHQFSGLMLDDNFHNLATNQRRHRVTPSNVGDLFRRYEVPREVDLLSLDTDGNEWLLWSSLHRESFSPRVVIIEFNPELPFDQDIFVRFTDFPLHRFCLATKRRFPWLVGGSLTAILALGRSWGYHLIHVVTGGTSDLIFVRADVLQERGVSFPGQDNPAALCALAAYQQESDKHACSAGWREGRKPPAELLTTSAAVQAGDLRVPVSWDARRLAEACC
eukprot:TRINITY_DN74220_c0_g1_i1.p1 TRINITY_DN74220_c0_g1~~TRINITY_DN74220_c0_g1_i1.p1  ORF type:complete len:708 (+),score=95.75 TRINITY_DN74220_c0_g1_i1:84-2207(+)